ncbi:hypothetical protein BaRGS_00027453, partial [Batillaria attramentaria]
NVVQHQVVQQVPPGARPGCGYIHPADAKMWQGDPSMSGHGPHQNSPKNISKEELQRLLEEKHSLTDIAYRLGISRPTLYKQLRKHKLDSAFKFTTNEQIMKNMRKIVAEIPEAETNVDIMLEQLNQVGMVGGGSVGVGIGVRRVLSCMKKLNKLKGRAPDAT